MSVGQPTEQVSVEATLKPGIQTVIGRILRSPTVTALAQDLLPSRAQIIALACLSAVLALGLRFVEHWRGASGNEELTSHYYRMVRYHERVDANVEPGSALFFGDSLIQSLNVAAVTGGAINYGIGQDTTEGLKLRLPNYTSLSTARVVVLSIGINDVFFRGADEVIQNYQQILQIVSGPVVICSIMPTTRLEWNGQSEAVNQKLTQLAAERPQTMYVDLWQGLLNAETALLDDAYHVGDGVHLNEAAAALWIEDLRFAVDAAIRGVDDGATAAAIAQP